MGNYLFNRMLPYPAVARSGFGPGLTVNGEDCISVSSTLMVKIVGFVEIHYLTKNMPNDYGADPCGKGADLPSTIRPIGH